MVLDVEFNALSDGLTHFFRLLNQEIKNDCIKKSICIVKLTLTLKKNGSVYFLLLKTVSTLDIYL